LYYEFKLYKKVKPRNTLLQKPQLTFSRFPPLIKPLAEERTRCFLSSTIMDALLRQTLPPGQQRPPRAVLGSVDPNTVPTPLGLLQKPGSYDPTRFLKTTTASVVKMPQPVVLSNQPILPKPAVILPDTANAAAPSTANPTAPPADTTTQEYNWEETQKELDQLFVKQSKERMNGVPMIGMPKIFEENEVQLHDHQKDGIRWLVHKEVTNESVPPFYVPRQFGSCEYLRCIITSSIHKEPPAPLRNSILADE
jgi:hypothetical protein